LHQLYKRHKITYKRVDVAAVTKLKRVDELKRLQKQFLIDLVHLQTDRHVFYMDETSLHAWYHKKHTWCN
jgi:hypothetical protein